MNVKILQISLEYFYGVGGLKAVLTGLLPSLQANEIHTSIVTPYYDFIDHYNLDIRLTTQVSHMYKKRMHTSNVFTVIDNNNHLQPILHFLIQPLPDSPIAALFEIGQPENIYKSFNHSEAQYRIEYFNSAVAALIKLPSPHIPKFDIIQTHAWHTSLVITLVKEFDTLCWQINKSNLNPTPKIINTIHMLSQEQGIITEPNEIRATLESIGLPVKTKFLHNQQLNQMYLGLQYADQVLMVSNGVLKSALYINSYNLQEILLELKQRNRIHTINNGIVTAVFDPTSPKNLGQYAIDPQSSIYYSKQKIKKMLLQKYHHLNADPTALWFVFIGRFAVEKGIDLLPSAFVAINRFSGNLIIMGKVIPGTNITILKTINSLKLNPNILVIENDYEQQYFGKYFRAAADFTIVPSHYEACGLVPMEAMLNYSIPITSNVQGLGDLIIPLTKSKVTGNGFMFNHSNEVAKNLQLTIQTAIKHYTNWIQTQQLDRILNNIHEQAKKFDWQENTVVKYINLYQKTLENPSYDSMVLPINNKPIRLLHVALEYQEASWGGLGTVTTDLVYTANKFHNGNCFNSSIITPYYKIFKLDVKLFTKIYHQYNDHKVKSTIYLHNSVYGQHYLIKPSNHNLFNLTSTHEIYNQPGLIERIKYFNSATASFIATYQHAKFDLVQLHDWPTALTAVLLKQVYNLEKPKIINTIHINHQDCGVYSQTSLHGLGLNLTQSSYILKQLGVEYTDYTVGVSKNIVNELADFNNLTSNSSTCKPLTISFLKKKYENKFSGILNGINYKKVGILENSKLLNIKNLALIKLELKKQICLQLMDPLGIWRIDPTLPLIVYIGRYSKEKGIDLFKSIINAIKGKATFCALGKGYNAEILQLILEFSKNQDNVFISLSEAEQNKYGNLIRTAAEFVLVPSHTEACGLSALEGMANGGICITSGVGGISEFIKPFHYQNHQVTGNGFLYEDLNENSLLTAINQALDLWRDYSIQDKHIIHQQLIQQAKQYDWLAPSGAIQQYFNLFEQILNFQGVANPTLRPKL